MRNKKFLIIGFVFFTLPVFADNKSDITSIQFTLDDTNFSNLNFDVPIQKVTAQVSDNLTQWQYPVSTSNHQPSHMLTVIVGKISNQSTPTGISFSSGNSDPRSVDFQKADVLPISCQLKKTANNLVEFENKMTFSAYQISDDITKEKSLEKLIDQISTTCLNLLDENKVPKINKNIDEKVAFKPMWMPDIQVEVKQKNNINIHTENTQSTTLESGNEESEKELIIHNQGSLLTIHFGPDRR